jgi:transcriptional regulator with XRE-family HTH domain
VRDAAHLSDRQIAAATGARPSTVRDWLSGRSAPTGARADRLIELAEMTDRLARVMEPGYIPIWPNRPLEVLDDDKPAELLARGDYRRVAQVIAELEYPRRQLEPVAFDIDATRVNRRVGSSRAASLGTPGPSG